MQSSQWRVLAFSVFIPGLISAAQTPVNFSAITSAGESPANIYAVDVNNDGLTDIVSDGAANSNSFYVSINNGNGTFNAPVTYTLPAIASPTYPKCLATADFNGDGNVDLVVPLLDSNEIAVYPGNGDGTFKAPVISTINLPSGYVFTSAGCAAADFNEDGNIDLVAWTANGDSATDTATELYVFEGEGNGSFSSSPYPVLAGTPVTPGMQVLVGDYNSDGMADIATEIIVDEAKTGAIISTTLHVLYGTNNFAFEDTTPYTANHASLTVGSGDLNSDGYTDLFALTTNNGVQQLGVFYGDNQGTFETYWIDTPYSTYPVNATPPSWGWQPQFAMADYNGDGRMDLAAIAWSGGNNPPYVEFFLAGTTPGTFTTQVVDMPQTEQEQTTPVAGLFSGSYLAPDVTDSEPGYLMNFENMADGGWYGPCYYPHSGEGFNVCQPGTVSGSTALFSAAVNSFGKLRKIELWVDGVKVSEQHDTWDTHGYFDWSENFSAGTHQATFFASDIDNRLQQYNFTFTIQ
jgi:hypothetical protein